MPRPFYPLPWEASTTMIAKRSHRAVIFRLLSPYEIKQSQCQHRHHRHEDALVCAQITVNRLNAARLYA